MPNFNGSGPFGSGPMTGRGLGPCCGAQSYGRGMRRGAGLGAGGGFGMGGGFGPRMGWFPAGYSADDQQAREAGLKSTLEERAAFLKAELERTESMLKNQDSSADVD